MRLVKLIALMLVLLAGPPLEAEAALLFAVNEGSSSSLDALFRQDKYADLANALSDAIGQRVKIETSNILPSLIRNVERQRYDVLFVRPSHISAQAMRDHGYRLLVVARGEAKVHFIVRADSPLKTLQDIHGRRIVFPNRDAYPTQIGQAMLRDAGLDLKKENVQYLDRQEAVGYTIEEKIADVGVIVSYSKVGKGWLKAGGRFLATKEKLPYWSVIVSPKVGQATVQKLKKALTGLELSAAGQDILQKIGVTGFADGEQQDFIDMLDWVEGRHGR